MEASVNYPHPKTTHCFHVAFKFASLTYLFPLSIWLHPCYDCCPIAEIFIKSEEEFIIYLTYSFSRLSYRVLIKCMDVRMQLNEEVYNLLAERFTYWSGMFYVIQNTLLVSIHSWITCQSLLIWSCKGDDLTSVTCCISNRITEISLSYWLLIDDWWRC